MFPQYLADSRRFQQQVATFPSQGTHAVHRSYEIVKTWATLRSGVSQDTPATRRIAVKTGVFSVGRTNRRSRCPRASKSFSPWVSLPWVPLVRNPSRNMCRFSLLRFLLSRSTPVSTSNTIRGVADWPAPVFPPMTCPAAFNGGSGAC